MDKRMIGIRKCPCGHRACRIHYLVGIGSFYEGSGFSLEDAQEIVTALIHRYPKKYADENEPAPEPED